MSVALLHLRFAERLEGGVIVVKTIRFHRFAGTFQPPLHHQRADFDLRLKLLSGNEREVVEGGEEHLLLKVVFPDDFNAFRFQIGVIDKACLQFDVGDELGCRCPRNTHRTGNRVEPIPFVGLAALSFRNSASV